ncbi:Activator of Hsp90 ATPase -like protein [uncultured archaeon]|nr:Activator of Hsp90 ATPase -like protein [uncultured archaeon]
MKTKTLHQTIAFKATPHEVYEALMDSKKHTDFTEAKAVISRDIVGKFTAFDGWASGKNVELVKDKKIVQTWRSADWPDNHYSTITVALKQEGVETILDFTQTEIPIGFYNDIKQGWADWYWDKLKVYLE